MRDTVLEESHAGSLGGHLGEDRTLSRIREKFFWPGYAEQVRQWCKICVRCAMRKNPTKTRHGALQSVRTGYPMQMVAADIMGPLPTSKNGNRYILVASDYFTRWVEAYAIPNQEAITVARKLVNNMFCRFSLPEQLHTDMGAQFESKLIKEMCTLLHINKTHTTPYHPQSDGLVERLNRTIQAMLATAIDEKDEWEECLPKVCLAYNTSEHSATGFTPFYMMFGRQANMPLDIIYGTPTSTRKDCAHYTMELKKTLEQAYQLARQNMGTAAARQKELYDRKVHGEKFTVGQLVWLCNPVVPRGNSRKLHSPWVGPYKVVKCISETVYRIQDSRAPRKRIVVHFDRLKLCDKGMRTPADSNGKESTTSEVQQATRQLPPGTNLQIVEDYDGETDLQRDEETIPTQQQNNMPREDGQQRRYPIRNNRRRPARYREEDD